ncbi:MAG: hypothetical protein KF862_05575 [Chitinophagaceae bacterium]|nr:hypothetical protein [Chitinophagaceae bacterium]
MQAKTFIYNKRNQQKLAFLFLGLGILGAVLALYMWLWANPVLLSVLVGGVLMALLGIFVFLKLIFAPGKENETAITITNEGITADTTPVAKAARLIEWSDVGSIQLYTQLLELKIREPEKYAARMKSFFVRDAFLKSLKGTVRISLAETNATYNEMKEILSRYGQNENLFNE